MVLSGPKEETTGAEVAAEAKDEASATMLEKRAELAALKEE